MDYKKTLASARTADYRSGDWIHRLICPLSGWEINLDLDANPKQAPALP